MYPLCISVRHCWYYSLYVTVYGQVTTWWIISLFCLCPCHRRPSTWLLFVLFSYSGRRRWFLCESCTNGTLIKNHACMCRHLDFRSLFLQFRANRSRENSFVCSCEFHVIQVFQISDCLTIIQGYGPGPRFIETLPLRDMYEDAYAHIYIYIYINMCTSVYIYIHISICVTIHIYTSNIWGRPWGGSLISSYKWKTSICCFFVCGKQGDGWEG